tara:strand:+ start:2003 stop:2359 length:357 start_codon:yes stop_codon:yes gene_type:complete
MDTVYISGLRIDALIGIHPWERNMRQTLVLDLEMAWDTGRAAISDGIQDALDYAAVSERVIRLVRASEYHLIESLAEEVARVVREEFAVSWLRVDIAKPGAVPQARAVGVVIERGSKA